MGESSSPGSWGTEWLPLSDSRSYQKQVEYFKWHYEYLDAGCNHYHWLPNAETGGTDSNVGIERNYSRNQFLRYDIVGQKRLCGSNTWPSKAAKLMERRS